MGTLLNENADEQDPGIMCKDCDNIISEATKDPNLELEDETRSISINNREFEFFDVYCPDLKEPNSFLWDESAKIY